MPRLILSRVIPFDEAFDKPTTMGPLAQIIHAAIDIGIGRAALAETIAFVKRHSRPWIDSGQDRAGDDPYTIAQIGELTSGRTRRKRCSRGPAAPSTGGTAEPSEETVAPRLRRGCRGKGLGTEAALAAANKLHELAGTRSTLAVHNLDRHWRNVRVHTLHDPVRWKYAAIGNYYLNGVNPPRHGAI